VRSVEVDLAAIKFDSAGLVPAIAQDADSGEVLMLAWMTADSLRATLAEGRMVYWSRSRGELWRKGETSGDVQTVREAFYDCDGDTLLFKVTQHGRGACHTGARSCFFTPLGASPSRPR
jgi:phosphoribosyl-AMP cyclohydrolase